MLNPRVVGIEIGRQLAATRLKAAKPDLKPVNEPVVVNLPAMQVNVPEALAPTVNVAPASVEIQPAVVNVQVDAPSVSVEAPNVTVEAPIVNMGPNNIDVQPAVTNVTVAAPNVDVQSPTVNVAAPEVTVDMVGIERVMTSIMAGFERQAEASRNESELLRMSLQAFVESNRAIAQALKADKKIVVDSDGMPIGLKVN
jgi:hypothetical protein